MLMFISNNHDHTKQQVQYTKKHTCPRVYMLPNKDEGLSMHPGKNCLSQAAASSEEPAFGKDVGHTAENQGDPFPTQKELM
jgi:hypothetical protein